MVFVKFFREFLRRVSGILKYLPQQLHTNAWGNQSQLIFKLCFGVSTFSMPKFIFQPEGVLDFSFVNATICMESPENEGQKTSKNLWLKIHLFSWNSENHLNHPPPWLGVQHVHFPGCLDFSLFWWQKKAPKLWGQAIPIAGPSPVNILVAWRVPSSWPRYFGVSELQQIWKFPPWN